MDWVHCNACSYQPSSEKGRKFLLTNCGHIYCNVCVEAATKPACRVCKSACTAIQLTSQMTPDIQHYFSDPEDLMRKAMQVFTFQRGHRQRLSGFRSSANAQHLAIAAENKELKAKLALQAKHIALMEQKISQLKKACNAYAAVLTPVHQQQGMSPSTPNNMYLSPQSSQRAACVPGTPTVGEKRISPHFSPLGFPTPGSGKNSPSYSSPTSLRSQLGEHYKNISPRERFLSFMP